MGLNLEKFFPPGILSKESIEIINQNSELVQYKLGQVIMMTNQVSNKILLILDGEARLSLIDNDCLVTLAKLGPGSLVGLGSLLKFAGCESVNSCGDLKGVLISDDIIKKIYKTDLKFKNFCDSNLFPEEIASLTKILINNSSKVNLNHLSIFNSLIKACKLNDDRLSNTDFFYFLGSNLPEYKIGQKIDENLEIENKNLFTTRIFSIRKEIYKDLFLLESESFELKRKQENNLKDIFDSIEFKSAPVGPEKSRLNKSNYFKDSRPKIIQAKGEIREFLACIQMIAIDFKVPYRKDSLERILRDEVSRGKSISLELSTTLVSFLGLHVSGARIKREFALRVPSPSLVIWKGSFAVIKECDSKNMILASPKEGWITINPDEIDSNFEEEIEVLIIEKSNTSPNKKFGMEWFIPSIIKYKSVLAQVLIASFVVQLFGLANPLLIQVIIDKVISQRSLDTLQVLGIAMIFVTIIGGILGGLRTFLFAETTNRIDTRLGSEVIDHLLKLPLSYFDKKPVGELGSRVSELERIRDFLTGQALTTILDAIFSILYIIIMVIYSWLLTLIALGVVPIQILLTLIGSPLLRKQIRETAKQNAATQSHLVEVLTGIQTVKAQNIEKTSRWKWQDLYGKYISRTFEKTITTTVLSQFSQVLQQLSQLLVLWVGASLVLSGKLTLGQLIAFRIISGYVTQPLLRLSTIWQNIQELKVSFERLADIIDNKQESDLIDRDNIPLPEIKGDVKFENVSFSFNKNNANILNKINLEIKQGTFVGIAGQSGSGKSTLMKLLPRLYNIQEGKILIDNFDINKVELYSLRRQIGIVPQDPLLLSGTINDNISITNTDIGSDEIIKTAQIAEAHDFIMELPFGYSTNVGERGASLSGGQRQRIAIARTLISKPKLLIMDEATSALDYETERKVCENLRKNSEGTTVFFITHRLSTIRNADKIIMMHNGIICEIGTHDELMEKKGRYFALFKQQEFN